MLTKWLDDFKSKFSQYKEAEPHIKAVEDSLQLYNSVIGGSMAKVEVDKAREERGVILEYGLTYHLPRFVEAVRQIYIYISNDNVNHWTIQFHQY